MKISNIKSSYAIKNNNLLVFEGRKRKRNTNANNKNKVRISVKNNLFNDGFIYVNTFERNKDSNFKTIIYDTNTSKKIFRGKKNVELSKCANNDLTQIEFNLNKKDSSTSLKFSAPNSNGKIGGCEFSENKDGQNKKISMYWEYPKMKYHVNESMEDMETLKRALSVLYNTISSDEYRDDFGSTKSVNYQLKKAIGYLERKTNNIAY